MASRIDNNVTVAGWVIRKPAPYYTKQDKLQLRYQIEIEPRSRDGNQTFMPFVRCKGNQAKRDLENIEKGDYVSVNGRIVTRPFNKVRYFIEIDGEEDTLKEVLPEELEKYEEDKIKMFTDQSILTEVLAEDVKYIKKLSRY